MFVRTVQNSAKFMSICINRKKFISLLVLHDNLQF